MCKQDIPFERLEAIPYTTRCIEHAIDQELPTDRPIEEEVLHPPMDNSFADRPEGSIKDYKTASKMSHSLEHRKPLRILKVTMIITINYMMTTQGWIY